MIMEDQLVDFDTAHKISIEAYNVWFISRDGVSLGVLCLAIIEEGVCLGVLCLRKYLRWCVFRCFMSRKYLIGIMFTHVLYEEIRLFDPQFNNLLPRTKKCFKDFIEEVIYYYNVCEIYIKLYLNYLKTYSIIWYGVCLGILCLAIIYEVVCV